MGKEQRGDNYVANQGMYLHCLERTTGPPLHSVNYLKPGVLATAPFLRVLMSANGDLTSYVNNALRF